MEITLTPTEQEAYDERVSIMVTDAHLPEWQAEKEAMEGIIKRRGGK